jgi:hypothetical protein
MEILDLGKSSCFCSWPSWREIFWRIEADGKSLPRVLNNSTSLGMIVTMPDALSLFELVMLKGGECSIRSLAHGETMHIGSNPRTEALALHITQQRLLERVREWQCAESQSPFVIWDIGLGPAGNTIAAIETLRSIKTPIEMHSFELDTAVLEFALQHAQVLDYLLGWETIVRQLLEEGVAFPLPHLRWQLHRGDFSQNSPLAPTPSSIFFDPYSPMKNPEMWSLETFSTLWRSVSMPDAPPCLMTNYTRSTAVRVTMALAGWFVGRGVSTGEKSETTIVANRLELLVSPLDHLWLERVRVSSNAAPLRVGNLTRGAIDSEDFDRLKKLSQFSL